MYVHGFVHVSGRTYIRTYVRAYMRACVRTGVRAIVHTGVQYEHTCVRTLATSVCISFDGAGVTLALLFVCDKESEDNSLPGR